MSKFIFDSMVPKYPEFLSSISSHLSPSTNSSPATSAIASQLRAVAAAAAASSTSTSPPSTSSLLNYNNNTNSSSGGADLNSLSDSPHQIHQQPSSTTHNNKVGGEENHSPLTTSSAEGSPNSPIFPTNKMYPYVSAHPAGHAGLTGMSFSGLEDKSCRWVKITSKLCFCFSFVSRRWIWFSFLVFMNWFCRNYEEKSLQIARKRRKIFPEVK